MHFINHFFITFANIVVAFRTACISFRCDCRKLTANSSFFLLRASTFIHNWDFNDFGRVEPSDKWKFSEKEKKAVSCQISRNTQNCRGNSMNFYPIKSSRRETRRNCTTTSWTVKEKAEIQFSRTTFSFLMLKPFCTERKNASLWFSRFSSHTFFFSLRLLFTFAARSPRLSR